jgi:NAD(P)-dependent dehydrogenase (short-subunit alcohol dehydrogenase family)
VEDQEPFRSVLAGKVIVVTGAGGGLGRAYARDLTSAGAAVVVNDVDGEAARRVVAEITAAGGRAVADDHTVAEADACAAIIDGAIATYGRLDGLVNNAGLFYVAAPHDDEPRRAAEMVAVNLLGTLYCGLRAIRHMVDNGGGVIVNDTSGAQSGMSRRGTYGATKGATSSLTYSWALDLGPHGIRVNAVSPIAHTAMVDYGVALGERGATWPPEHVAPLVTYLMSDASVGVSGQVIRLDGPELSVLSRPGAQRRTARSESWDQTSLATTIPGLIADSG